MITVVRCCGDFWKQVQYNFLFGFLRDHVICLFALHAYCRFGFTVSYPLTMKISIYCHCFHIFNPPIALSKKLGFHISHVDSLTLWFCTLTSIWWFLIKHFSDWWFLLEKNLQLAELQSNSGLWSHDVHMSVRPSVRPSVNILVNATFKFVLGYVYEYRSDTLRVYRPW